MRAGGGRLGAGRGFGAFKHFNNQEERAGGQGGESGMGGMDGVGGGGLGRHWSPQQAQTAQQAEIAAAKKKGDVWGGGVGGGGWGGAAGVPFRHALEPSYISTIKSREAGDEACIGAFKHFNNQEWQGGNENAEIGESSREQWTEGRAVRAARSLGAGGAGVTKSECGGGGGGGAGVK